MFHITFHSSLSHPREGLPHNALRSPSCRKEYGALHLTRIAGVLISFSGANVLTITCEQGLILYQPMTANAVMASHKPIRIYMAILY